MNIAFCKGAIATLLLIAISCTAWLPAVSGDFVWDDHSLIESNPQLEDVEDLIAIWTGKAPDYFPVTYSLWWLEKQSWGNFPTGFRIANGVLYALCCLLVWRVFHSWNKTTAWWLAALFAVHPLQVSSVAWISETKNLLSLFWILLAWLPKPETWIESGTSRFTYARVCCCFIAGLLSKPSVVVFPLGVWLVVCFMDSQRSWAKLPLRLWFMLLLAAFISWLTVIWQQSPQYELLTTSLLERVARSGWIFWHYLEVIVWPRDLQLVSTRWTIDPSVWTNWLPLMLAIGLYTSLFLLRRQSFAKIMLLAFGLYGLNLLPVMGIFDMRYHQYAYVADHLAQQAWLNLLLGIVVGLHKCISTMCWPQLKQRIPLQLVAAMMLAGISWLSWERAKIYQSDAVLWLTAERENPQSGIVQLHCGIAAESQQKYGLALVYYKKAATLDPLLEVATMRSGIMAFRLGDWEEAQQVLKRLVIADDDAESQYVLGKIAVRHLEPKQAAVYFRKSLVLKPENAGVLYELAKLERQNGNPVQALELLRSALHYEDNSLTRFEFAEAAKENGQHQLAIEQYKLALVRLPTHVPALNNAAWLLATTPELSYRDPERAVEFAERAVKCQDGNDPAVWDTLATAYYAAMRRDLALQALERAIVRSGETGNVDLERELKEKRSRWIISP